ncbi:unnamed protein product, partial [Hapterophycus canaliculatus]
YSSEDGSDSDPYDSASTSEDGSGSESSESGDSGSDSQQTSDGDESDSSAGSRSSASSSSSSASGRAVSLGRTSSASSVMSADPEADTSASFPSTLLRQQTSGGLKVDFQFSRGRVSALSRPSTKLTLRLTFTNYGETPVRRIRVVAPRDGTPMEAFPEIQVLAPGATNTANLGIDFGGKAKDVRFELKTDRGSFMVSIEPPSEELLFPSPVSRAEFQRVQNSL